MPEQQPRKLQQRPALSLVRAPTLAVKLALPREKIEAAAVFSVQRLDNIPCGGDYRLIIRHGRGIGGGEICKQTEHEIIPLAP